MDEKMVNGMEFSEHENEPENPQWSYKSWPVMSEYTSTPEMYELFEQTDSSDSEQWFLDPKQAPPTTPFTQISIRNSFLSSKNRILLENSLLNVLRASDFVWSPGLEDSFQKISSQIAHTALNVYITKNCTCSRIAGFVDTNFNWFHSNSETNFPFSFNEPVQGRTKVAWDAYDLKMSALSSFTNGTEFEDEVNEYHHRQPSLVPPIKMNLQTHATSNQTSVCDPNTKISMKYLYNSPITVEQCICSYNLSPISESSLHDDCDGVYIETQLPDPTQELQNLPSICSQTGTTARPLYEIEYTQPGTNIPQNNNTPFQYIDWKDFQEEFVHKNGYEYLGCSTQAYNSTAYLVAAPDYKLRHWNSSLNISTLPADELDMHFPPLVKYENTGGANYTYNDVRKTGERNIKVPNSQAAKDSNASPCHKEFNPKTTEYVRKREDENILQAKYNCLEQGQISQGNDSYPTRNPWGKKYRTKLSLLQSRQAQIIPLMDIKTGVPYKPFHLSESLEDHFPPLMNIRTGIGKTGSLSYKAVVENRKSKCIGTASRKINKSYESEDEDTKKKREDLLIENTPNMERTSVVIDKVRLQSKSIRDHCHEKKIKVNSLRIDYRNNIDSKGSCDESSVNGQTVVTSLCDGKTSEIEDPLSTASMDL